jgi:dTDP-4-amino-4,6-dideoxygalactose transaminase
MDAQTPITIPHMDLSAQTAALKEELLRGFRRVLDNNAFCLGPEVQAFEKEFAAYCGSAHGIGVNSGTSALHLALLALGVGPGDEVITTPFTFAATAWAISYCGATPVFADIDPASYLIDPKAVEKAITPRTKAIVPVHLYGQPVDLDALLDLAKRKGLPLVEDAAQAHGATYRGRRIGSFGDAAAFSFYPSKNLGACGEAGIVLTQNAALAAKIRALREHGQTRRYYHDTIGFNYRMEGLQGCALRIKLPHLDTWVGCRQKLAALYGTLLQDGPVQLPRVLPHRTHAYHLYVVRHKNRDSLCEFLKSRGIGTSMHYPVPLHLQQAYAQLKLPKGSFPHAEAAAAECLSLPIFAELKEEQVETVATAIKQWSKTNKNLI